MARLWIPLPPRASLCVWDRHGLIHRSTGLCEHLVDPDCLQHGEQRPAVGASARQRRLHPSALAGCCWRPSVPQLPRGLWERGQDGRDCHGDLPVRLPCFNLTLTTSIVFGVKPKLSLGTEVLTKHTCCFKLSLQILWGAVGTGRSSCASFPAICPLSKRCFS